VEYVTLKVGWNGTVGITTRYGLDVAGIEFRWDPEFPHPSIRVLGYNQPPIKWVPVLSTEVKRPARGVGKPPPAVAEVKDRVKLYSYSPSWTSWPLPVSLCKAQREKKLEVQKQI